MAKSKRLVVQLGNGASTEVFAYTCGSNSWTVTMENTTGEVMTLDCTDPLDNPASMERWTEAQTTSIKMDGTVTTQAFETWRLWSDSGSEKNVKVLFDESGANNGGHWIIPMLLSNFEMTKEGSGVVNFSATMVSTGPRVWTDAS